MFKFVMPTRKQIKLSALSWNPVPFTYFTNLSRKQKVISVILTQIHYSLSFLHLNLSYDMPTTYAFICSIGMSFRSTQLCLSHPKRNNVSTFNTQHIVGNTCVNSVATSLYYLQTRIPINYQWFSTFYGYKIAYKSTPVKIKVLSRAKKNKETIRPSLFFDLQASNTVVNCVFVTFQSSTTS